MKALIDEDLPKSLKNILLKFGFEVIDLRETSWRGASDEKVFNYTQKISAILFTGDLDFSNILKFPPGSHHGIVILRFPNELSVGEINKMSENLLKKIDLNELKGNITILSPNKIRIRKTIK